MTSRENQQLIKLRSTFCSFKFPRLMWVHFLPFDACGWNCHPHGFCCCCCCCCFCCCCASGDIAPTPSPPKDLPQCVTRNSLHGLLCYQFSLRAARGLESTNTNLMPVSLQGPPGLIRWSGNLATLLRSVNDVLWLKLDYPNWHCNSCQVISCLVMTYACMARDVSNPKGHVTRDNFLASCLATNVARQVARKIPRVTPQFCNLQRQQNVPVRVAIKKEISLTFRNVARPVAACDMSIATCNAIL